MRKKICRGNARAYSPWLASTLSIHLKYAFNLPYPTLPVCHFRTKQICIALSYPNNAKKLATNQSFVHTATSDEKTETQSLVYDLVGQIDQIDSASYLRKPA
jgi:hypothetical protein